LTGHRLQNLLHSVLLLAALLGLLWLLGWLLGGAFGVAWAMALGVIPVVVSIRIFPAVTLRMYGARPLSTGEAVRLYQVIGQLAGRAGLTTLPRLHYIPSRVPLVFSVGSGDNAAIAMSDGLLRLLTMRELIGVLAHELSHIVNRDTWVMSFADVTSRITRALSLLGQLLLLLNLPLYLLDRRPLPWLPLLLMAAAPSLSALLQLALSRTREFDADLAGARLSGDPIGLASALAKLEGTKPGAHRLFRQGVPASEPSLLRTHPRTEERIRRLRDYHAELSDQEPAGADLDAAPHLPDHLPPVHRHPRRRLSGLWH
jgi:heat shock protein HtpX